MPKVTVVATTEVVGQGSVVEISTDDGVTFVQLLGIQSIPQIGTEGTFFEVQDISELVKRYQRGLRTPPEWAFSYSRIGSDALQDAMAIKAQDSTDLTPLKVLITYTTGDTAAFDLILNGYYFEATEQGDNKATCGVKGQVSGDIVFGKVA